jgi:SAM-dependent methyltransferase
MTDQLITEKVSAHFAPIDLPAKVSAALANAGKNNSNTTIDDLAGLDQWHVMGVLPVERLAETAGVSRDTRVLDVGVGMGGPARYLAATYGCSVIGVDITDPYLETAQILNELTGLDNLVTVQHADATALPFEDGSFEVVWTEHAAQSIPDKAAFFSELHRVLVPGGRLVVHDLYRGAKGDIHFPAFWGPDDSISFLVSDRELRETAESVGLQTVEWTDTTQEAWDANAALAEGEEGSSHEAAVSGLDITLLFGLEATMEMAENSVKDFEDGSIGIFEAVFKR